MSILRPREWVELGGVEEDGPLELGFEELGLSGRGRVVQIRAGPGDRGGPGCPVIATIRHTGTDFVEVSVQGSDAPLVATAGHYFYSATRGDWVVVEDLVAGETVVADGEQAIVEALERVHRAAETVYNLEVAVTHEYLVGEAAVRVHNDCDDVASRGVTVSASRHPESAAHIKDAQAAGKPSTVTIDRAGAKARRREAMKGHERQAGMDRDEYPPAMFKEGGSGSSVRGVSPGDNRGAGACIGAQCRGLPDGTKVDIKVGD